ncbi:MAG: uracil-DNA glycosylase [candidate division Zixibacteria bacterium]|nr:uracil-DNA glycosylase [candidate division Zixibacteria bacterium]
MKDESGNLNEMLQRALKAQVELGLGGMIVDSKTLTVAETDMETPTETTFNSEVEVVDMFAGTGPTLGLPQYESLEQHREDINECHLCPLAESRTNFVYGAGNSDAELMFVGEAPGRDEDLRGEPFVGRAGKLLDKILAAMEMSREQVYISNILKCRPPGNRDPQPDEMEKCFPYLKEQIRLIRPKVLCALGRIAAQALLDTKKPLGRLRGEWHKIEGVPMLVTYHPAALLRFPAYKADVWKDMQMIMARLQDKQ